MKNGFVYRWLNQKTNMTYVGRHLGSPDDGYIASSPDFLTAYEIDKKNWKREILFAGDYELVKKQESLEIKKAVKEFGIKNVFNKCSSTTAETDISKMSQGKLYSYQKEIDLQIEKIKSNLDQLHKIKSQILIEKKKFSTRKCKI